MLLPCASVCSQVVGINASSWDWHFTDQSVGDCVFIGALLITFIVSAGAMFNQTARWRQLRASAGALESIVWQYRTRVGEFVLEWDGPLQPDKVLQRELSAWRDK